MKSYQKLLAVIALSSMCLATAAASDADAVVKKTKKHSAVKTAVRTEEKPACEACEAIKELKEQIKAQQAEIDQLKNAPPPAAVPDQQAAAAAAAAQQQAAAAAAAAAEANAKATAAQSDVAGLKTEVNSATLEAQNAEKKVGDLEHPTTIAYKHIRLTPGGFLAAEGLWRQHAENADIGSYYSGSHFPITADANTPDYHLTEFRGTARQSRISLLAEGQAGDTKLTGYYEMDFLGAAATANENQSNSWQPRIRQLFGQASRNGWTLTAGQMWSLLTTNKKGTEARTEWSPATIDAQYIVGYTWARLMEVRVAKSFDNDKVTAAFAIDNPATLIAAGASPAGTLTGGTGVGQLGNGNTYTTNLAPDLIAKVAFDPGYGHYELKVVGRFFRDRVGETNSTTHLGTNYTSFGGGIGAGAILPLLPKKLDFVAQAMAGRGIGRYGDSSDTANGDVTFKPNGSFSPLQNLQVALGIEAHPTPKLDLYVYGGDEYLGRDVYGTGSTAVGYGLPTVTNTGCFTSSAVPASTTCAPITKNMLQGSAGFWYNFYKGGYGTLRYGMQYSYTYNNYWRGVEAGHGAPSASENMAFTSLRYYLP
jgi:hypothetical protein